MTVQYSTTHRNNALADITTQAGATANLLIYSGSPPANCAAAATGTLLATLPMSNPIAPAPSSGVLTMSAITGAAAAAGGAAGYWRICTSSAGTTVVAQGTIAQSGGDLNFAGGTTFVIGETINVSGFTITESGA